MKRLLSNCFVVICCLLFARAGAQSPVTIKQIIAAVDTFNNKRPAEKLFIHLDKTNYIISDTIWFKAYLLDASSYAYSPLSGLFYLDMINDYGKVVKRTSWPVSFGSSWGQIVLDKEDYQQGNYTLRAYTNWMQNFGQDYFFSQQVYVSNVEKSWLVTESHHIVSTAGKQDVALELKLSNANHLPIPSREVALNISDGKTVIYRNNVTTKLDGSINGNFTLPVNITSPGLSAMVIDKKDPTIYAVIPLGLNRNGDIDLQFMPEGGYMVAGLPSRIGFKAIAETGLGTPVEGKIVDSKGVEVTAFKSAHLGMGSFKLTPVEGEKYSAIIKANNADSKRFALPDVKSSGIVLSVDNTNNDSVALKILVSPALMTGKVYHVLGLSRGVVCYAANLTLDKALGFSNISKAHFPTGIAHFTLFDETNKPVNERIIFINHNDNLNIEVKTSESSYLLRDSIPVNIKVTNREGQPITGSFSMSVTDDSQVKIEQISSVNIVSNILLTSDLIGPVENPSYYFTNNDPAAADLLMLTQGWVGYNWPLVFKKVDNAKFAVEKEFIVTGKIRNLINSAAKNAKVILMNTTSNRFVKDTTADKDGRFTFNEFPLMDTMAFVVEARNSKGRMFGIGIEMDTLISPVVKQDKSALYKPWYVNADSIAFNFAKNSSIVNQQKHTYGPNVKVLQEVVVRTKKSVRNSNNLNGPGEADQVLDEKDMEKLGTKNLRDILVETVKGFQVRPSANGGEVYLINNQRLFLVVDGLNIRTVGGSSNEFIYNNYLTAQDIIGIEVMHSGKFNPRYDSYVLHPLEIFGLPPQGVAYIEITTRSGNGYYMKKTPGVAVYKPLPVSTPKKFYSPRYIANSSSIDVQDLRSTIYWQPNLVTNKQGQAFTSFYSADIPGTYTVIIQGADMNGSVGFKATTITISSKK